jgi:hypothetical protein
VNQVQSYRSILVAVVVSTALGAPEWIRASQSPWEILGALAGSFLVVRGTAHLLARTGTRTWAHAFRIGLALCTFQAAILAGSVIHEHKPLAEYAVRAAFVLVGTLASLIVLGLFGGLTAGASMTPAADRARGGVRIEALAVAAVAALFVGGLWYSPLLFGGPWAHLKAGVGASATRVPAFEVVGELFRSGLVAFVIARFVLTLMLSVRGALALGGGLWLGFHATLLLYSVVHEEMPWALFGIHAGHGLANDLVIGAIVGAWHKSRQGLASPSEARHSLLRSGS